MNALAYVVARLMPFAVVSVVYDILEFALVALRGGGTGRGDEGLLYWACDLGASVFFCLLPYLCYLLVLPAAYHGSQRDRCCTALLFALFVLLSGAEELSEVLSGDQFGILGAELFQNPAGTLHYFATLPGVAWWLLGMLACVAVTFYALRGRLLPRAIQVPPAWQRAALLLLAAAAAFTLLSLPEGVMNTSGMPEIYRDGIISLFGDLIAMTAVPDLTQIFRTPVLQTAMMAGALLFMEGAFRFLWPDLRSPGQLFREGHARLCARYGALRVHLLLLVLALLVLRWGSLGAYPLMDTTEARYGEMARKMLETGNWLQPQFDYGVPFWGKPPLSFWGSALTMKLFGVSEFAARFAPYLAAVGMAALFFCWPFRRAHAGAATREGALGAVEPRAEAKEPDIRGVDTEMALACAAVFLSSVIGVIASGSVMTDAFLALGTTLTLVSFRRAMEEGAHRIWGYAFFVGLAIGLLSKGPLALVLGGLPVFLWALRSGQWRLLFRRLPMVSGCLLMLVLVVPWYWAAECRTPGFLRYFIVGEHFERYLVKGWSGDLYGAGHSRSIGTIWIYALESFLPWTLLLPFLLRLPACLRGREGDRGSARRREAEKGAEKGAVTCPAGEVCGGVAPSGETAGFRFESWYLWCWALAPLVFFTAARNILPAYVLPAAPAWCMLLVQRLWRSRHARNLVFACVPLLVTTALFLAGGGFRYVEYRCQRELLQGWERQQPLYYVGSVPYSAQFYSAGHARAWSGDWRDCPEGSFLAVPDGSPLSAELSAAGAWQRVAQSHGWLLFRRVAGR